LCSDLVRCWFSLHPQSPVHSSDFPAGFLVLLAFRFAAARSVSPAPKLCCCSEFLSGSQGSCFEFFSEPNVLGFVDLTCSHLVSSLLLRCFGRSACCFIFGVRISLLIIRSGHSCSSPWCFFPPAWTFHVHKLGLP
jgi:hypothetical protein